MGKLFFFFISGEKFLWYCCNTVYPNKVQWERNNHFFFFQKPNINSFSLLDVVETLTTTVWERASRDASTPCKCVTRILVSQPNESMQINHLGKLFNRTTMEWLWYIVGIFSCWYHFSLSFGLWGQMCSFNVGAVLSFPDSWEGRWRLSDYQSVGSMPWVLCETKFHWEGTTTMKCLDLNIAIYEFEGKRKWKTYWKF